jgi:hypothetical protein
MPNMSYCLHFDFQGDMLFSKRWKKQATAPVSSGDCQLYGLRQPATSEPPCSEHSENQDFTVTRSPERFRLSAFPLERQTFVSLRK